MALALSNRSRNLGRLFDLAGFLRWWGQGLLLWLPASIRQRLSASSARHIIYSTGDTLYFYEERGEKQRELSHMLRSELEAGQLPAGLKFKEQPIILRLASEQVLCTQVNLPLAAENNLNQVVGFELDRLTPFNADKVFYDARLLQRQVEARTLQARIGVILRASLAPLLTQLQNAGLMPDRVEVEGDDSGLNLLPTSFKRRRLHSGQRQRRVLWALIILTLCAIAIIPLWQQRSIVVALLPKVDAAQREAQRVIELRERLDNAINSSQFLLEKRRQSVRLSDLLYELTLLLPDTVYLEQLSLRNGQVELRGQAAEATALIGLLEESDWFSNVTFRSPVVKDNRTGQDRFVINAPVVPGLNPSLPPVTESATASQAEQPSPAQAEQAEQSEAKSTPTDKLTEEEINELTDLLEEAVQQEAEAEPVNDN